MYTQNGRIYGKLHLGQVDETLPEDAHNDRRLEDVSHPKGKKGHLRKKNYEFITSHTIPLNMPILLQEKST